VQASLPHSLRPAGEPGDYLAFLGRLTADKGPEAAIRIARAAGKPLHIAAKLPRGERGYFKETLEPQIDGRQIRLTGEVNDKTKEQFLAGAAALLFPIDWPEPFGLVMIEAMACGTPVIAFRSGSVPEVVDHGVTGFIVDDEDEAVQAINRLGELDRREVRARFEQRFSAERMAQDYVGHYKTVAEAEASTTGNSRRSGVTESKARSQTSYHDFFQSSAAGTKVQRTDQSSQA
jgi:glycosyltransferase involved in cell wall biosynthesis